MADKGIFNLAQRDYDGELTTFVVEVPALTDEDFAAQEAALDALRDSAAQITLGNVQYTTYGNRDELSATASTDPYAQREKVWLIECHDEATLDVHALRLACADTQYLGADRVHMNLETGSTIPLAFKSHFEAVAKSPQTGNALIIDRVTLVSANR